MRLRVVVGRWAAPGERANRSGERDTRIAQTDSREQPEEARGSWSLRRASEQERRWVLAPDDVTIHEPAGP